MAQSSEFKRWQAAASWTGHLFEALSESSAASRRQRAKFEIIDLTQRECRRYRLGVSLESRGHLWTPNPKNPIHFWQWEPQGEYDKAPTTRARRVRS